MVTHFSQHGHEVRCRWGNACRRSDDWNRVDCKRCLKLRTQTDIETTRPPKLFEITRTTTCVLWVLAGTEEEAKQRAFFKEGVVRSTRQEFTELKTVRE